MVTAANRGGYSGASVTEVIGEAGVSRPTFYEYFTDRDDCFTATATHIHARLLAAVRDAVAEAAREDAALSAIGALVEFATAEPANALFLMNETMSGGPAALDARDAGIAQIAQVIEDAQANVSPRTAIPDIAGTVMVGATYRWLAARLRRGERALGEYREDLQQWAASYSQPASKSRWRTLEPGPAAAPSPFVPESGMRAPAVIPPGRTRLTPEEVAENHRLRIMFAAAQLAGEHGYTATTIGEITRRAGVDGRAFYAQFTDKQQAFMAVHELGFQDVMAVTAGAFFAGADWPERSWEAARAFTQFLENNPTLTHVGVVEAYAVGRAAAQRVEDSHVAFTIFLQEGFQYRPQDTPPSRAALEAIIAAIFELVYLQARRPGEPKLTRMVGQVCHLWLTPFLGTRESNTFIDRKLKRKGHASTSGKAPAGD